MILLLCIPLLIIAGANARPSNDFGIGDHMTLWLMNNVPWWVMPIMMVAMFVCEACIGDPKKKRR
jgi:hypothetical protein